MGACDVGCGEDGCGEDGCGEDGCGEDGGGEDGGGEVGDAAGDGLFCAGGLGAAHGVDDGTVLPFPAEEPGEADLEPP